VASGSSVSLYVILATLPDLKVLELRTRSIGHAIFPPQCMRIQVPSFPRDQTGSPGGTLPERHHTYIQHALQIEQCSSVKISRTGVRVCV
jgi:hypothetical protein